VAPVAPKLSNEELMKTNTYIRFNNFMDKIFEQLDDTEGPLSMDENEDALECISAGLLSNVSAEAAKLKARQAIDAIPEEKLTLLISYAMRSVHAAKNIAAGPDLPDDEIADDNLEKVLNAIEASLLICNIYTSKDTKFLQEDNVDAIIKFVQFQLRETLFPSYDPVYTIETKKKVEKKKKSQTYQQKGISQLYTKVVELSKLFVRLFNKFHFVDTIIIHASALGVEPFFVDNIETLQFVCLDLVTSIFQNEKYKHHRHNILNDILSSVDRLPHSKRNLRPYKLTNNGGNIQMMTALVLQLIQCAVILPDELCDEDKSNRKKSSGENASGKPIHEKDLFIWEKYETATSIGGHFLQTFLTKCKSRNIETDFRPLFENFIHDLLTTVNKPEWPASELLLSLLGRLLINYMSDKNIEQSIRVVSLEYLGIVAARLRKDTVESRCKVRTMDELIKCIKEEQEKEGDDEEDQSLFEIDKEEERSEFLQRILLDYLTLNSQEENPVWNHARHFYMCQWYRDIMHRKKQIAEGEKKGFASRKKSKKTKRNSRYKSESEDDDSSDCQEVREVDQELNLEVFRILEERKKFLLSKIMPFKRNSKNVIDLKTYLDYDNANLIAQYLASKRSFSQSFDTYLKKIILVVK
jgi:cohesin loading factor subunit SCC2